MICWFRCWPKGGERGLELTTRTAGTNKIPEPGSPVNGSFASGAAFVRRAASQLTRYRTLAACKTRAKVSHPQGTLSAKDERRPTRTLIPGDPGLLGCNQTSTSFCSPLPHSHTSAHHSQGSRAPRFFVSANNPISPSTSQRSSPTSRRRLLLLSATIFPSPSVVFFFL